MSNLNYKVIKHSYDETIASKPITMGLSLESAKIMSDLLNARDIFRPFTYDYYRMSMSEVIRSNRNADNEQVRLQLDRLFA